MEPVLWVNYLEGRSCSSSCSGGGTFCWGTFGSRQTSSAQSDRFSATSASSHEPLYQACFLIPVGLQEACWAERDRGLETYISVLLLAGGCHWDSFTRWRVNFMNHFLMCIGFGITRPLSPAYRSLPPGLPFLFPASSLRFTFTAGRRVWEPVCCTCINNRAEIILS